MLGLHEDDEYWTGCTNGIQAVTHQSTNICWYVRCLHWNTDSRLHHTGDGSYDVSLLLSRLDWETYLICIDNGKHYCILHCMQLWNFWQLDTVLCDWDEKLGRLIIFGRPSSVNAVFSLAWGVHRTRYLCLHTLQRRTETSCHDICLKTTFPPALNPARIDTFTNSLFMTNGNLL